MTNPEIFAVKELLSDCDFEWAIGGGWAVDLFLGKQTRLHKDIDIFIWRDQQLKAQSYLLVRGWSLDIAYKEQLTSWQIDDYQELPVHTVWCKHETFRPDYIELLFNERNESQFLFRRDQSITVPIEAVVLKTEDEIPYLVPEIALLYKSNNPDDDSNHHDYEVGFPKMGEKQQKWLLDQLKFLYGDEHQWVAEVH